MILPIGAFAAPLMAIALSWINPFISKVLSQEKLGAARVS